MILREPAAANVFFYAEKQMRDGVTVTMPIPPAAHCRHTPQRTVTVNPCRGVHHNSRHTVTGVTVSPCFRIAGKVGRRESKHSKRITFCHFVLVGRCPNPFEKHSHSRKGDEHILQNRARAEQLIVRVTPEEKKLIQKKMEQLGTDNFSRYARKMLIDGYVIHVDLSEFNTLAAEVHKVGININQIARTVNSTSMIYGDDMNRLKEMMDEIWRLLKSYLSDLLSKSR